MTEQGTSGTGETNPPRRRSDRRILDVYRRITQIGFHADTLEDMLQGVLDEIIALFDCDRAWFLHPCDPEAPHFRVPMERTKPAWPGACAADAAIPMDPDMAWVFTVCLHTPGPLTRDERTDEQKWGLRPVTAFSVRSQMFMALYPRTGQPWMFGMHYCAAPHDFTEDEIILFDEIGHRIAESLSNMLILRELSQNEKRFRLLFESMSQGVIAYDHDGHILSANPAAQRILGLSAGQLQNKTSTELWAGALRENNTRYTEEDTPTAIAARTGKAVTDEVMGILNPLDQRLRWLIVNAIPHGDPAAPFQIHNTFTDITDLKEAHDAIGAHMRYLDVMERINHITASATVLDDMLRGALEEVLRIFGCDRAWILYPCDPEAKSWSVPMECTRPEWPGAFALKLDMPATPETAAFFRDVLASSAPLCYDPQTGRAVPEPAASMFTIRAQMVIALRPRIGDPWVLGIHHCATPHVFSEEETAIFHGISERIGDALSSLLTLRHLSESEERFRTLVEHAPEAIIVIDAQTGRITQANQNAITLFKYPHKKLLRTGFTRISSKFQTDGQRSVKLAACILEETLAGGVPVFEWIFRDADGLDIPCEVRLVRLPGAGRPQVRGSITDISARKRAQAQMRKLSTALEQTADAIMITDVKGTIEYVNAAFEHVTGYSRGEAIGQTPRLLKSEQQGNEWYATLWETILAGKVFSGILINRRKNGEHYYEERTITPLKTPDGTVTHFIATGRDISERVRIQEQLQFMAHHDALTGLPNRTLFTDRMMQAIAHAQRQRNIFAVLFLDADRFKMINDTLGHETGDRALRIVAKRLTENLRASDTVARLGGDEFAVILESINSSGEVASIVQKLVQTLARPMLIDQHELFVTSSIGISIYPDDGADPATLLKHADTAMYRAKEQGRNCHRFYSAEMGATVRERLSLETRLHGALKREEFRLHYQPQISLTSGAIIGVEALLRWQPPDAALIPPDEFIPALEETGLIVPVGEWVLRTACAQIMRWRAEGLPALRISVNISSRQFSTAGLGDLLAAIIGETGMDPACLDLEITESVLLSHDPGTGHPFKHLRDINIGLAIDDFGTGYSSLSYLRRFPIDTLKIDRSFVRDITDDPDDAAIVLAIIAMAKSLKLDIIAEGVETQEQLDFFTAHGCTAVQGYLFSQPLPAAEMTALLKNNRDEFA